VAVVLLAPWVTTQYQNIFSSIDYNSPFVTAPICALY
jgi:hypothetical protein